MGIVVIGIVATLLDAIAVRIQTYLTRWSEVRRMTARNRRRAGDQYRDHRCPRRCGASSSGWTIRLPPFTALQSIRPPDRTSGKFVAIIGSSGCS